MSEPRLDRVPRLARAATVYGTSNVLQRIIPIVLLPVLARYLNATDFGFIAVFTAVVGLATPFVGVNISYSVRRAYFDRVRWQFPVYVWHCLVVLGIGSSLSVIVITLMSGFVELWTGLTVWWLIGAVVVAASQVFMNVPLTIWQVEDQPTVYGGVQVARAAVLTATTLIMVVAWQGNWTGVLSAMIVTHVGLALLVGLPFVWRWVSIAFEKRYFRHVLAYGGGLIPHTLATLLITSTDRFVVNHYVGVAETGLYWIGYQIGFVVSVVADSFNRAWSPWLYAVLSQHDEVRKRRAVRIALGSFVGFGAVAAIITIGAPWIIRYVLSSELSGATKFVGWIALGFAFNGMYRVVAGFLFYSERTMVVSWITGLTAVINLGLNLWLVPTIGAVGAAMATTLAFFVGFVLTFVAAQRVQPMPWVHVFARQ